MSEQVKKLVPKLRFPEFQNAEAWKEMPLKSISPAIFDGTHQTPTYVEKGIPFYSVENLISGNKNKFISEADHNEATKINKPEKEDILVTRIGNIGFSAVVTWDFDFSIYVTLAVVKKSDFFNSQYLHGYIQSPRYQSEILKKSLLNAVPCKINMDELRKTLVLLPNLEEQQKIADCLSSLDDLITAQNQKVEALKQHKKGLMQQLFPAEGETIPKLRFSEFENESWNIKSLGKVADNLDFKRVPITESDRKKGETPYYGASGIIDYVEGYIFEEDLLCISEDGANLVARTYPIAFSISGKSWVNNHAHVLKFNKKFTQVLIENYLNLISLEDYLTGMAQPKLNQSKLELIPIPLPENEDEQKKIANLLSSVDEMILMQTQKLVAYKTHKKGLMQQLFPSLDEVA